MKKALAVASLVISAAALAAGFTQGFKSIKELLVGYEEVPAVSTVGSAEFRARISDDETSLDYELSYADLEGTVTQAHIHFGQRGVNGGISVWLCSNLASPPTPPGTPACPPSPATVTGTLTAANVVGPAGQGIAAGEFAELIRAVRAGKTYANVHSSKFPGGEVRSQIEPGGGDEHSRHE